MPDVDAILHTDLPLPHRRQGKVRDIYDATLPDGSPGLLLVVTDRISAFDVVMANGVPGKGVLLTQISRFWFDRLASSSQVPHHLISMEPEDVAGLTDAQREMLRGRMMLCRKTRVVPIECVVRGYLAGSGYKEYVEHSTVCSIPLPPGLRRSERLEEPIFTPSTKAEKGHDENISFEQACEIAGEALMKKLRDLSLAIYIMGRDHAAARGILLADTKFEFGLPLDDKDGQPILIDEVLTPDSSRFWPADGYQPGEEPLSLDKQYVRNHLEELVAAGKWDKTPPGPTLPTDVVINTLARYQEAYDRLTGAPIVA